MQQRFKATIEQHRQILSQFMQAVGTGQLDGLMHVLSDDVTMWVDGGGKARGAATRPLHGCSAVAQFVLASTRYLPPNYHTELAEVNGQPAAILRAGPHAVLMIALEVDHDHVREVRVIGNPDKLRGV
jgi:RNA polymerase sigma-70 factor (ECF subfamily)